MEKKKEYDFFISHASEDKTNFVRPLVKELTKLGFKIWYDEFTLKIGDSLFQEISNGIKNSQYGIVIISKNFLKKEWTKKELNGLINKEIFTSSNVILPIWLEITAEEIYSFSPILADKISVSLEITEIDKAVSKILEHSNAKKIDSKILLEKIEFLENCDEFQRKKYIIDTENRIKNLVYFQEAYYEWFCSDEAFGEKEWDDFLAEKKCRELQNLYNLPFDVEYNPEFSSENVMNHIINLAKKWINKKANLYEIYELIFLVDYYHEMDLPFILFGFSQESLLDKKAYDLSFFLPYKLSTSKQLTENKIKKAQARVFNDYYS